MTTAATAPRRLPYIEGLRGLAALVVAVGHIAAMPPPDSPKASIFSVDFAHLLLWPFLFGGQAVWLFLMVSGFALYYSEMTRRRSASPTPMRVYGARRMWRILPVYYVGLGLGLAVALITPALGTAPAHSLDTSSPVTWSGLASHLLLVQNFRTGWLFQISSPLWSVAIEAQWYCLLPLLTSRRLRNPWAVAGMAFIAARGVQHITGEQVLGLAEFFLAGVLLAHVCLTRKLPQRLSGWVGLLALTVGALRLGALPDLATEGVWLLGFAALILYLHARTLKDRSSLRNAVVQQLGRHSYSLYAVHFPCALLLWDGVARLPLSRSGEVLAMLIIGLPVVAAATRLCYLGVETPSLRRCRAAGAAPRAVGLQDSHVSVEDVPMQRWPEHASGASDRRSTI